MLFRKYESDGKCNPGVAGIDADAMPQ